MVCIDKSIQNIRTVRIATLGIEEVPKGHRSLSAHSEYTLWVDR